MFPLPTISSALEPNLFRGRTGLVRVARARLHQPLLLLLEFCVWLLVFVSPASAATQLPLNKPLRFGTDKIVQLSAELARHRVYYLDIAFPFRDAQQRAYMSRIVGEPTRICKLSGECGVTTAFLITIKKGEDLVLREERRVFGRYAFDVNKYYRNIVTVPLKPTLLMLTSTIGTLSRCLLSQGTILLPSSRRVRTK
jgi:hypothetical protein